MTDPVRWLSPGGNPPPGARELLRELSPPPRIDSLVRARIGVRIADHAAAREPARLGPMMWLSAALVGTASIVAGVLVVGGLRSDDVVPTASPPPAQKTAAPAQSAPPPQPEREAPDVVEERSEEVEESRERTEERVEERVERVERVEERTERRTVRRERHRRRVSPPRERVARRAPAPAEPREVADRHGTLSVGTIPWARVFLDGEDIGLTPIVRRRIPAGVHDIRLEGANGAVMRMRVMVQPDQDTRLHYQLGGTSTFDLRMR